MIAESPALDFPSGVRWLCVALACAPGAQPQQTLGGITGTVTDTSGGVLPDTMVTLVGDQTSSRARRRPIRQRLLRISWTCRSAPTRSPSLTTGSKRRKFRRFMVQADRTVTVNAALKVGAGGHDRHGRRNSAV